MWDVACIPGKAGDVTIKSEDALDYAFYNCDKITSLKFEKPITLGSHAFDGCSKIEQVEITEENRMVLTYADFAFANCTGLKKAKIKTDKLFMGEFINCKSLEEVTIEPYNTEYSGTLYKHIFYGCPNLKSITCRTAKPYNFTLDSAEDYGYDILESYRYQDVTLYVPTGSAQAYKEHGLWKKFGNIVEKDMGGVDDVFANDDNSVSVFVSAGTIRINGAEADAAVAVYDLAGRTAYSGTSKEIALGHHGIYIVAVAGKTFKVADTVMVAGTEKDTVLATFSFDDTAAEQAEEEPVRPVLRARMLRSAVEPSFDATVSVDRSDASKIVFHMEDPCKRVTVSLPCSFTDGTVKLGQTEILDAKFDGQTVSFQTKKAGTYVIESKTPVQPKPDDAITGIISGIVASGALQPGASASQFADLTAGSWYYGGVRYALENGLMTGTSARTFAPDRPVTRAMLVTILWRLAGEPYGRVSPFEDVLPGSWYAQAVSWAYDKGIVTGVTATSFQPGAPVTREQLCAILCRYAALTGKNTAASASLDAFTDRAQVSAYAEASVRWALQAGLLTGVGDGRLAPRSGATRAQLAVLLQRFAGLK